MAQPNPILAQIESTSATPADVTNALTSLDVEATFSDRLFAAQELIQESSEVSKANVAKLEKSAAAQGNSLGIIQGAIKSASEAAATVALTKDTATMEAENNTIAAHQAAGGTRIQEELMTELGNDIITIERLEDNITDIHSTEITGIAIIDEAINGIRSSDERRALKRAISQKDTTRSNLSDIASSTQQIAQTNLVTRRTTNEATIAANQTIIKANSDIKSTQAELDTLNSNAIAISRVHQATQQQVQNQLSLLSLADREESRAIQKEKLVHQRKAMEHEVEAWARNETKAAVALEQAELNLKRSKSLTPTQIASAELSLAESQKQVALQDATNESIVSSVRKAQASFGTVPKGTQEEAGVILAGIRRRDPKYLALLEKGSLPQVSFGLTPAEARANFNTVAPTGAVLPTRVTKLLSDLEQAMEFKLTTPAAGTGQPPKRPKKGDETDAFFNQVASEYMAVQAANIKAGDASNPLQAPPMATLLQSDDLKLQPLYTKVLAPMNMTEVIPQTIVDAAASGVASKQISIEEAVAGITSVFQLSALINSEQDNGFKAIGLPSQTTYNTVIARPAGFVEELSTQFKSVFSPSTVARNVSLAGRALSETLGDGVSSETLVGIEQSFKSTRGQLVNLMDDAAVRQMMVQQLNNRASTIQDNVEGNE